MCLLMALGLSLTGCSGKQKAEIFLSEEQTEDGKVSCDQKSPSADSGTETNSTEPENIFVDVCGAVQNPGVYGMSPGSRVFQAIEMAGGFLPEAAETYINQAVTLSDGQQIYVPTKEEVEAKESELSGAKTVDIPGMSAGQEADPEKQEKINLNTADSAALQTLSGIGEAKAAAILAYREEHGGFSSIEEIMNVPGIKESTFSNIKDKIAVE